jgi:hypothetical protein
MPTLSKDNFTISIIIKQIYNRGLMMVFTLFCFVISAIGQESKSVYLIYSYPVSMAPETGNKYKILSLTDTILITNYNDYVLYRLPGIVDFETNNKIMDSEPYFIYKKNDKFGAFFTSIKDIKNGEELPIDSFLTKKALRSKDFDIPPDSIFKLEKTIIKKDFTIEKFIPLKKNNETIFDSIIYYYSKRFNQIGYSFSGKLDSLKQMKLFKIRLIYNEYFSPSYKTIISKREYLFEIQPAPLVDKNLIIDFIKRLEIFRVK